jgi:hypothetical protein
VAPVSRPVTRSHPAAFASEPGRLPANAATALARIAPAPGAARRPEEAKRRRRPARPGHCLHEPAGHKSHSSPSQSAKEQEPGSDSLGALPAAVTTRIPAAAASARASPPQLENRCCCCGCRACCRYGTRNGGCPRCCSTPRPAKHACFNRVPYD